MPKNKDDDIHPYSVLAREIVHGRRARAVFLYIDDGMMGSTWALEAPANVAAMMPEILVDVAEDIRAGIYEDDSEAKIITHIGNRGPYADLVEKACQLARGTMAFLYVLEGDDGSEFSIYAPPEYNFEPFPDFLRGVAWDLAHEEPALRDRLGLEDPRDPQSETFTH